MILLRKLINWNKNRIIKNYIFHISEFKNIEGWLTDKEAYGLYSIARQVKNNGIIVEIGSWKGKSTYCIAKGLKNGKIFAIDPFNADGEPGSKETYEETKGDIPLIEQFKTTMNRHSLLNKIEILKGYSSQFIDKFIQIDFLFIDGNHSIEGCDFDYLNYSPLIKKSGFIALHDYYPQREDLGPTWVIKNRLQNDTNFKFIRQFDSLWVARKK